MQNQLIVILGATGNTGRAIIQRLGGHRVRGVARSADKLAQLGVEARAGDFLDREFLTGALRGADAVYAMTPGDPTAGDYRASQDAQGAAIVDAIRAAGVRRVVALSSVGADLPDGHGVLGGLYAQEQRLRTLDASVTLLRPGSFFENFAAQVPVIRERGIVADSVAPDIALPMVAIRDIAAAAAAELASPTGPAIRELLGPRDLTYSECAALLGAPYVPLPGADIAAILVSQGLSPSFAAQYVAMTAAFNARRVTSPPRTAANTTPTRFEDVARELLS